VDVKYELVELLSKLTETVGWPHPDFNVYKDVHKYISGNTSLKLEYFHFVDTNILFRVDYSMNFKR